MTIPEPPSKPAKKRSLAGIAGIVALATLISKIFGLVREQAIARAFGVGPVVNAYAYAYILPGFLLILLGGINGPFHSALVSVLAKRPKEEAPALVETVTTYVTLILLVITIILFIFAGFFIDILAPGLQGAIRDQAILQLRIMTPLAVFAGLIGIGFGTLNAADQYWLPSISPLFSSITVVLGVGWLIWVVGEQINQPQYLTLGGVILAGTTLAGGLLQWIVQVIAQWRAGLGTLKLRWDWHIPGVTDVLKVMGPATLSSGMLHINVYTDMYFASFIPTAAAAMRYANFMVLTPLGIVSNMILVPFLPVFAKLTDPENWPELKQRIRQGLVLTALTMLPLSALFIALARPLVQLIYQYGAFCNDATAIVVPVLMAYGLGMFFYLARDVMVRVFYALGDGETPFRISIINIFLNGVFDYFFVQIWETPGLIFATIAVNVFSLIAMVWILHRRLGGFPLGEWLGILFGLGGASACAGLVTWGGDRLWLGWFPQENLFTLGMEVALGTLAIFGIFIAIAWLLRLPELTLLQERLMRKFKRS